MSKVIVFENCEDCPKVSWGYKLLICRRMGKGTIAEGIPDWCPLPDLPEKEEKSDVREHLNNGWNDFAEGWNACLDAITGGEHDQTQDD